MKFIFVEGIPARILAVGTQLRYQDQCHIKSDEVKTKGKKSKLLTEIT